MRWFGWFRGTTDEPVVEAALVVASTTAPPTPPGAVTYRTPKLGLRVTTRYGAAQFRDGWFTTDDPEIIFTLDGLASREPNLLAKENL